MNIPKPNGKVHPVTAMFPMLPEDELDELAADLKANGQLHPIVLDKDGTLIDGRNRQEAGKRAGIKLTYEVLDGQDYVAFILSQNDRRRHMSKGQRAMIAAKVRVLNTQPTRVIAKQVGVAQTYIAHASIVLEHANELSDAVLSGDMPLNEAYQTAQDRKAAANSRETQMTKLRQEAADLADLVVDERMTLPEAFAALKERKEALKREQQRSTEFLRDVVLILDHRSMDPKEYAQSFVDRFSPTFTSESVTKERLEKCLIVLKEITRRWKEELA